MSRDNFQDFLEELKSRADIVNIVKNYITLQSKGRNMWGLCPFHHEKTPSFSVNSDGQFYHCFGCGVSGDVISFVKEIEGVEFMDAVKMLAEKTGMQLPQISSDNTRLKDKEEKDKLMKMMRDAANYYHFNLLSEGAKTANDYLLKRGLNSELVKRFGLGYSLGYTEITNYLSDKGYSRQMMLDAGIIDNKDGKYYDSLFNRLIFPICDPFGQVIAFGGRLLENKDYAKYKNTRETKLFIKNKTLYGLHLVKKLKLSNKIDNIIVVEGYMDLIALSSAGINNVVASMGTSLTKEQAKLIKRQTDTVIIAYDGDSAGQTAAFRGMEILYNEGLNVKVVSLPDKMDPDDAVKKLGAKGMTKLIDEALPYLEYKLLLIEKQYDLRTLEGKGKYASSAIDALRGLNNSLELLPYVRDISLKSNVDYNSLKEELLRQDKTIEKRKVISEEKLKSGQQKAEKYILYSMLYNKPYVNYNKDCGFLFNLDFSKRIYNYIIDSIKKGRKPIASSVLSLFQEKDSTEIIEYIEYPDPLNENEEMKYYSDCINYLVDDYYKRRLKELTAEYDSLEDTSNKDRVKGDISGLKQMIKKFKEGNN